MNNLNTFLESIHLFWQYPVITEKTFYEQNNDDNEYIGVPWATIIDKINQKQKLLKLIYSKIDTTRTYYTCCQHIKFRALIPFSKP